MGYDAGAVAVARSRVVDAGATGHINLTDSKPNEVVQIGGEPANFPIAGGFQASAVIPVTSGQRDDCSASTAAGEITIGGTAIVVDPSYAKLKQAYDEAMNQAYSPGSYYVEGTSGPFVPSTPRAPQ